MPTSEPFKWDVDALNWVNYKIHATYIYLFVCIFQFVLVTYQLKGYVIIHIHIRYPHSHTMTYTITLIRGQDNEYNAVVVLRIFKKRKSNCIIISNVGNNC